MFQKFRARVGSLVLAGVAAVVSAPVFAQTTTGSPAIDVTGATATITNQLTSIGSIGTTILSVVTVIAAIAWVRRPIH